MKGYTIVRPIGRGTTAEVFEARDSEGKAVAIKEFPAGSRALQWHAWTEAELLSKLDHPAILKIHRFGEEEGRPYIVMALVEGPSLERRILEQGPMFQEDAVRMVQRIAEGIAHAHAAGICHGDLKPRNILLPQGDPQRALICDFGLTGQGTRAGDVAALSDLLKFSAGDHPLVERLRCGSIDLALSEIRRFLAGDPLTRVIPRRRGCLGL